MRSREAVGLERHGLLELLDRGLPIPLAQPQMPQIEMGRGIARINLQHLVESIGSFVKPALPGQGLAQVEQRRVERGSRASAA